MIAFPDRTAAFPRPYRCTGEEREEGPPFETRRPSKEKFEKYP